MHVLQSMGSNGRVEHLQCMPWWEEMPMDLYYIHMCIMYSCEVDYMMTNTVMYAAITLNYNSGQSHPYIGSLETEGLDIQKETSVWIGLPKSLTTTQKPCLVIWIIHPH